MQRNSNPMQRKTFVTLHGQKKTCVTLHGQISSNGLLTAMITSVLTSCFECSLCSEFRLFLGIRAASLSGFQTVEPWHCGTQTVLHCCDHRPAFCGKRRPVATNLGMSLQPKRCHWEFSSDPQTAVPSIWHQSTSDVNQIGQNLNDATLAM